MGGSGFIELPASKVALQLCSSCCQMALQSQSQLISSPALNAVAFEADIKVAALSFQHIQLHEHDLLGEGA